MFIGPKKNYLLSLDSAPVKTDGEIHAASGA